MEESGQRSGKFSPERFFAAGVRESLLPVAILFGLTIILTGVWDFFLPAEERIVSIFFKPENLGNILRQNAHYGILAVGMTLVIITGGIDLSVGSLLAFSSVVMASLIDRWPNRGGGFAIMAAAAGVLAGTLLGLLNGLLITYSKALPGWVWQSGRAFLQKQAIPRLSMLQIQPFIVTLAMMSMARGLAFLWTAGRGIDIYGDQPRAFAELGRNFSLAGLTLPWPGIIFLLAALATHFLLRFTPFGRHAYAIGSNENTARLCGVPVARTKTLIYGLSGMFCGLSAIIYTSVQNAGRPDDGIGFELDAIAAAVIGGASLMGGRGGIGGTLVGAIIIGVLNNVLGLRGIDPNLQRVLKGAIIIAAVLFQKERDRT